MQTRIFRKYFFIPLLLGAMWGYRDPKASRWVSRAQLFEDGHRDPKILRPFCMWDGDGQDRVLQEMEYRRHSGLLYVDGEVIRETIALDLSTDSQLSIPDDSSESNGQSGKRASVNQSTDGETPVVDTENDRILSETTLTKET